MNNPFYQPVSPWYPTQLFGANGACIDASDKVISCDGNNPPKGYKSLYGKAGHNGLDLRAAHNQEIYCALGGVVDSVDPNPRSGLDVRIVSIVDGRTFKHLYEHLNGYQVRVGDKLETGQLVGWAGTTGYSSGTHLHFGLYEWLKGKWVAIDPLPLMQPVFARDQLFRNAINKWAIERLAQVADRLADLLRQSSKVKNKK